eukprot:jgi/Mesen1/474/ME000101S10705
MSELVLLPGCVNGSLNGFFVPLGMQFLYLPLGSYMKSVRFVAPKKPVTQASHIFALHPHGRMFYSTTLLCQSDNLWRRQWLPQGDLFMAAAAGFFSVPLLRNLLYALGVMPASKANIVRKLRQGQHVAIVPGGLKEVCVGTSEDVDVLYLLKRKGFVKIALEEKVGIIPIYCFNENQIFKHDPKWYLRFWEMVNRYYNIGVPFMRGIWNLPMPFRRDILCVIGDPVYPRENDNLDDFHQRYVDAIRALFEKYVSLSPAPKHKLVII